MKANAGALEKVRDIEIISNLREGSLGGLSANYPTATNPNSTIHLIEENVGQRARVCRRLMTLGFHVEIYTELNEFLMFAPKCGVILVNDCVHSTGLAGIAGLIGTAAPALPILVYRDAPSINDVVSAMRANASNYLTLDISDDALKFALHQAVREGEKGREERTYNSHCKKLIKNLSARERDVLKYLVEGESNKGIARILEISPRTVEIHRMKMMSKMQAKSVADAVRMWILSTL